MGEHDVHAPNSKPTFRPARQITRHVLSTHKSAETKRAVLKYDDAPRSASITASKSFILHTMQLYRSSSPSRYICPVSNEDLSEIPDRSSGIACSPSGFRFVRNHTGNCGSHLTFYQSVRSVRPSTWLERMRVMRDGRTQRANFKLIFRPSCEINWHGLFTSSAAEISRISCGNGPSEATSIIAPPLLRFKTKQPQRSFGSPKYIWPVLRVDRCISALLFCFITRLVGSEFENRHIIYISRFGSTLNVALDIGGVA